VDSDKRAQRKEATRVPQPTASPTLRRRELGARLRELRLERSLTIEQVAEHLLCSPSKVSRMETGQRGATPRDVRDLCDLYDVEDPEERNHLARLAREGKQQGWWQSHDLFGFSTFVGLEEAAESTRYYQGLLMPGLLQTADYARAVHESTIPSFTPERVEELVQVRLTRQQLLSREPPLRVWAVIDEAALRRGVGGPTVMADQMEHLIAVNELPNVDIQVIPFEAGAHPAMDSSFRILEFENSVPDVVYVEGLAGKIYVEKPQDIETYRQVFEHLSSVALDPRDSMRLVARIRAEYQRTSASRVQNS
jgi:transcriptional regulator with XRE-family HTH domain